MGQPEKSATERVVPVKISQERVREYLEYRPTPEALDRRRQKLRKMVAIRAAEDVSRKTEEKTILQPLEVVLGYRKSVKPEQSRILEEEEKEEQVLFAAIEETGEGSEREEQETYIYSIKDQSEFKNHYKKWEEKYNGDKELQAKMTLEEFILAEGQRLIKQRRKLLTKKRTFNFYDKNADKKDLTEVQMDEDRDKLNKAVDMYIQANREKLSVYGSLDPAQQKILLSKFQTVLKGQKGLEKVDEAIIMKLFQKLAGDLEYAQIASQDYEYTYQEMIAMKDLKLTDEEWEARRQNALKKNAKGELKEYLQQQFMPTYAFAPTITAGPSFESIKDVANASGVNLRKAPGKGSDVYYVDFPTIKDSTFMPLMKIVYPPGAKSINDAVFVLEEPWIDKDAKTGEPIEKTPTREFKASDVPRAINGLILDYVLNKGIKVSEPAKGGESVNEIIRDTDMTHLAERLFGFKLEEKRILDPQVDQFKRFLKVVLRDDKKSSLFDRAKKVRIVLDDDSLVPYFRETLQAKGAATKTLDDVIEEAKLRREGKIR